MNNLSGYKYVSSRACPAKEPKKTYWAWVKYKPSQKPGINLRALDWGPGQLAAMSWNYSRFANLSGANLRGANLSGENLSWDDLRGANLSGAA